MDDDSDDEVSRPVRDQSAVLTVKGDGSDDSLPPLQSRSDTDDDLASIYKDITSESDPSDFDSDDSETESQYDTDEEQEIRELLREAMDTVHADPHFFDSQNDARKSNSLVDERKDNPFLKLLGSLRGELVLNL